MFKIHVTSLILFISFSSPIAMAQKQSINPWKHCGIGAMIFDNNTTAAAISNIIWDLGTTAISSKISSADSCEGAKVKTAMFIQQNYNQVIEETAKGNGQHIVAMMNMLKVNQSMSDTIFKDVRNDMAKAVQLAEYSQYSIPEKAEIYYTSLIANAEINKAI